MKTEYYQNHKKLLYSLAWRFAKSTGIDVNDLISEFNVVFCESFEKFDSKKGIKFSTFFYQCCSNRIRNILKSMQRKKNKNIEFIASLNDFPWMSYDPIESVIIYDNFVNSSNPIITKITKIISNDQLPKKKKIKPWLRDILLDTFSPKEIKEAFNQLSTLF